MPRQARGGPYAAAISRRACPIPGLAAASPGTPITPGCQVETIRYYEREGGLHRSAGTYRMCGAAHAERPRFILHCRSLDMMLDEFRRLLVLRDAPDGDGDAVNALLDRHIAPVATRIAELEALQSVVIDIRSQCDTVRCAGDCHILHRLSRASDQYL